MQKQSTEELTIENLDKSKFLNKIVVRNFVKKNIENLTDYTPGEENLLISLATGLTYAQLVLFKSVFLKFSCFFYDPMAVVVVV